MMGQRTRWPHSWERRIPIKWCYESETVLAWIKVVPLQSGDGLLGKVFDVFTKALSLIFKAHDGGNGEEGGLFLQPALHNRIENGIKSIESRCWWQSMVQKIVEWFSGDWGKRSCRLRHRLVKARQGKGAMLISFSIKWWTTKGFKQTKWYEAQYPLMKVKLAMASWMEHRRKEIRGSEY